MQGAFAAWAKAKGWPTREGKHNFKIIILYIMEHAAHLPSHQRRNCLVAQPRESV